MLVINVIITITTSISISATIPVCHVRQYTGFQGQRGAKPSLCPQGTQSRRRDE